MQLQGWHQGQRLLPPSNSVTIVGNSLQDFYPQRCKMAAHLWFQLGRKGGAKSKGLKLHALMCVPCAKGYPEAPPSEDFGFRPLARAGSHAMLHNKGTWESEYSSWHSAVRRGLQRGGRVGSRQCWHLDHLQGHLITEYRQPHQAGTHVSIQDHIGTKSVTVSHSKDKRMGRFYTSMLA